MRIGILIILLLGLTREAAAYSPVTGSLARSEELTNTAQAATRPAPAEPAASPSDEETAEDAAGPGDAPGEAEETTPDASEESGAPGSAPAPDGTPAQGPASEQIPAPDILRDEAAMPEAVRNTWRRLVDAARSGDFEQLRPIIEGQGQPPTVSFDEVEDTLEYLKSLSGDAESREILAIMLEILEAGFVHVDIGTAEEMYVWPYFARYPLDNLTPSQFVELFRLLTSADYQEMLSYGAYIFFRIGIAPDGTWRFFIAGD